MTISNTFASLLHRATLVTAAAVSVLAGGFGMPQGAYGADIEVYFANVANNSAKPNVLFILDTSQSMYTVETSLPAGPYDPAVTYSDSAGHCAPEKYYWASVGGKIPDCATPQVVGLKGGAGAASNFQCDKWRTAVDTLGFQTGLPGRNPPTKVAQGSGSKWATLDQQDKPTACEGDTGNTGPSSWGPIKNGSYTFYKGNYINYLRLEGGASKYRIDVIREVVGRLATTTVGVKMGLMRYGYDGSRVLSQNTATACEDQWDPLEGTRSGNGAPIVYPVTDIEGSGVPGGYHVGATARAQFRYELGLNPDGSVMSYVVNPGVPLSQQPQRVVPGLGNTCPIPLFVPGGRSPIGGAMYESYLYYSGQDWSQKYGKQNAFGSTYDYPSVASSRNGERYISPIVEGCAKNFIILLSDGTTEQDNDIDGPVERLPGFKTIVGGSGKCDDEKYLLNEYNPETGLYDGPAVPNRTPPPSMCVDDMAQYMYETDLSPTLPGMQNVTTYTVGFKLGTDAAADRARKLLEETAKRGGGLFKEAQKMTQLEDILVELLRQILVDNASFTAPAVAVNAFNRTENLDDLYIALFRPALNYRWRGNLKKYKLQSDPDSPIPVGEIMDATDTRAVDPRTGFFRDSARSYWTDSGTIDGGDITSGGAQSRVNYVGRNVYSNLTGTSNVVLTQPANEIEAIKSYGTVEGKALMGVQPGDAVTYQQLVDWVRGMDVNDIDGDTIVNENRYNFGDPLHSRPTLAIYGGTAASKDINDAVIYVTTNDGYLQAIDPVTGNELWAFMPQNELSRARNLFYNEYRSPETRGYGLDGVIRLVQVDNNRNGVIEPDDVDGKRDKVYLFFGQRRGGSWLYGMNVTSKTQPRLMWAINSAQLPGAGQSWSSPWPTRVDIGGVSTPVLIFGGGYATTQDQLPYSADTVGNRIFMVDALTGQLLWSAGPTGSGAKLELAGMNNAFAATIAVLDLTGDGQANSFYAADLGGRIWRFDVFNGKTIPSSGQGVEGSRLVEGGLFASLGNAEDASKTQANTLRFFAAPDVSIQEVGGRRFLNVAIGSGHRELPVTDLATQNWFFSVRDFNVNVPLLSSQYQTGACPSLGTTPCQQVITEGALADLTSIVGTAATDAVPSTSPGWRIRLGALAEKVLGEAVTLQGTVLFTTYSPESLGAVSGSCAVRFGTNRIYAVSAKDARPANNRDGDATEETEDRSELLSSSGTIAPPPLVIIPPAPVDCIGSECRSRPIIYCGLELCGGGLPAPPVRTFWRQRGVE